MILAIEHSIIWVKYGQTQMLG